MGPLSAELDGARERELAAQAALAQARARLDAIFTELREVESAAARHAERRAERRVQAENLRAQADRYDEELRPRASAPNKPRLQPAAQPTATESGQRNAALEASLLDARGRVEDAEREAALSQEELAGALSVHRDCTAEVTGAQSRLHTIEELENSLEGHVPGTRAIVDAWQRGELRGIEGIVSNLITTDERYARAMDVAFGAASPTSSPRTSEDAERAIEFLNRKESGRATFLPLDTLANREGRQLSEELRRTAGVIGYAHTLVETQPQYRGIVDFLVGNVLIVDQLSTGIALVRERGLRDTVVTLTGEQITGGGAITGGRFQRERSILSRRVQAQTLREALVDLRVKLRESEGGLHAAHVRTERRSKVAIGTGRRSRRWNCGSRGRARRRRRWPARKNGSSPS